MSGPVTWPARPRADQLSQSARRGTLASRRSTAAVFWPRARQGAPLGTLPCGGARRFRRVHSHDPLVVADGRCCSGASRERGYEPCTQDAASRSDSRLVSGDALGERDGTTIGAGKRPSNYFDVMCISLVIAAAESANSRAVTANVVPGYPRIFSVRQGASAKKEVLTSVRMTQPDSKGLIAPSQIAFRRHPQMLDEELHGRADAAVLQRDDRDRPRFSVQFDRQRAECPLLGVVLKY